MAKTKGQALYEKELAREPTYRAAPHVPRPKWDQLSDTAKEAWSRKAAENA